MFEEMESSCDRKATRLDSTKGHKTFAKAWELQVANTLRASLDGEDAQVTHRKSCLQLQQHCDDVQMHDEPLLLNSKEDPQLREVEKVFRSTRKEMTPHQSAIMCNPDAQCNRQHGRVQFGVPMALNTPIVANAFFVNHAITCRAATPQRPSIMRSSLGKEFRYNKFCWRCGFQKKMHNRAGNSFGDMCRGNCGYEQCSKCNQRVADCHEPGCTGPHCPSGAVPVTMENVSSWWKQPTENV